MIVTETNGPCETLPHFNGDQSNELSSKDFLMDLQDSLRIGGHNHLLKEVKIPLLITMHFVVITSGADLQGRGLNSVPRRSLGK